VSDGVLSQEEINALLNGGIGGGDSSSGGDEAVNSITEKAHELAADLGYTEVAYSYTTKEVNKSYVNRVETTKTVVDKEAWDETIPAGWYCDNENCSYYSSKEPEAYRDMDL